MTGDVQELTLWWPECFQHPFPQHRPRVLPRMDCLTQEWMYHHQSTWQLQGQFTTSQLLRYRWAFHPFPLQFGGIHQSFILICFQNNNQDETYLILPSQKFKLLLWWSGKAEGFSFRSEASELLFSVFFFLTQLCNKHPDHWALKRLEMHLKGWWKFQFTDWGCSREWLQQNRLESITHCKLVRGK